VGGELHVRDAIEPDPEVAQLHGTEAGEPDVLVPARGDGVEQGALGDELAELLLLLNEVAVDRLEASLVRGLLLELRRPLLLAFQTEEDRVRLAALVLDLASETGSLCRLLSDRLLFRSERLNVGLQLEVLSLGEELHQVPLGQEGRVGVGERCGDVLRADLVQKRVDLLAVRHVRCPPTESRTIMTPPPLGSGPGARGRAPPRGFEPTLSAPYRPEPTFALAFDLLVGEHELVERAEDLVLHLLADPLPLDRDQ